MPTDFQFHGQESSQVRNSSSIESKNQLRFLPNYISLTACEKLLTDGTGKPNADAINYYNNFIDALLEKGHHPLNHFSEFNFPFSHISLK